MVYKVGTYVGTKVLPSSPLPFYTLHCYVYAMLYGVQRNAIAEEDRCIIFRRTIPSPLFHFE